MWKFFFGGSDNSEKEKSHKTKRWQEHTEQKQLNQREDLFVKDHEQESSRQEEQRLQEYGNLEGFQQESQELEVLQEDHPREEFLQQATELCSEDQKQENVTKNYEKSQEKSEKFDLIERIELYVKFSVGWKNTRDK